MSCKYWGREDSIKPKTVNGHNNVKKNTFWLTMFVKKIIRLIMKLYKYNDRPICTV